MTAPVALPLATPLLQDTPSAVPDAPDDVFAAVLAALSGALGAPPPVLPIGLDSPTPAEPSTVSGPGALPSLPPVASPVVWTATTQRAAVAEVVATPVGDAPATAPVLTPPTAAAAGPEARVPQVHEPAGPMARQSAAEAPPTKAAAEHPSTDAPADPRQTAVPDLGAHLSDVTAAAQQLVPDKRVEAPGETGIARHVQPAVVEAARGLRHEGGGRTSLVVRLDPPELGAVLVRLTVQHGRVDVQLRTPDLAARSDLQAQSYDLQQVLREQGFDLRSFDVGHGDVFGDRSEDVPDRGTPQQRRGADGGQGNSHVTDDAPAPEPSGTWL
jgi:hypothetical protein